MNFGAKGAHCLPKLRAHFRVGCDTGPAPTNQLTSYFYLRINLEYYFSNYVGMIFSNYVANSIVMVSVKGHQGENGDHGMIIGPDSH